ncbi:MAG: hypothetical protein H6741_34020 [Alphaproteobacteria bacterium]|nr:hypothetical protein [Alphaproteobacteria bacterium]MCB9797736.1 hypothetical protein [Alphaproteobacteria bacterium]
MRSLTIALALALAGCATTQVYRASGALGFDPALPVQIDDDAIRAAFEARPQLPAQPRVALYSFDTDRALALAARLDAVEGVADTYTIPPFLVTGQRRFAEASPYAPPPAAPPVSVESLRLIAARARCDVLVVADHGWRRTSSANGLVALNVLLVPALFSPFLDLELESYLDLSVIDVRNGFLYGQVSAEETFERRFNTVWTVEDDALVDEAWDTLLSEVGVSLEALLSAS